MLTQRKEFGIMEGRVVIIYNIYHCGAVLISLLRFLVCGCDCGLNYKEIAVADAQWYKKR